jgi:hypothetical protein
LAAAARFGHRFGEIAEQHRRQQDRGHRPAEPRRGLPGHCDQRGQQCANHHHRHHRTLNQMPRRQLHERIAQRGAESRGI